MARLTAVRRLVEWLGVTASQAQGREKDSSGTSAEIAATTHPLVGPHRLRVIAGVDVGTSFSKVVVRLARRHLAVPFDDAVASENSRLLLPTALSLMDGDGKYFLGLRKGATSTVTDIKMPLIVDRRRSYTAEDRLHLTTFMALLLRHVWKWTQAEVDRTLGSRPLGWIVNLGVPTDSYDDELVTEYSRCATVAWRLAELTREQHRDYLTLAECRGALESTGSSATMFNVFPEFVAQVSSYVQTPLRKEGVHVMVDAGGGTLDVTVFTVLPRQADRDPVFPVFARRVERLGTRFLVSRRWKEARPDSGDEPSPFHDLPPEGETAGLLGISVKRLRCLDKPFYKEVLCCIRDTIKKGGRKGGLAWPGRLFLVGGGASVELYQCAYRKFETAEWEYSLNGIELPRPEDLEMSTSGGIEWHRLAVAYGLSFDPDDIGRIRPPDEIEMVDPMFWKADRRPPWV